MTVEAASVFVDPGYAAWDVTGIPTVTVANAPDTRRPGTYVVRCATLALDADGRVLLA